MDATYIIKKPLLTEKSTEAMNEQERYTFLVDRRATKDEIRDAVQTIYGVKVVGINTQIRKGKERRLKYGWVTETKTKKATVRLAPGQTIDLF